MADELGAVGGGIHPALVSRAEFEISVEPAYVRVFAFRTASVCHPEGKQLIAMEAVMSYTVWLSN
jgi:hypothetical protein